MRLALPLSGLLAMVVIPFALAGAGGWGGQRSFSVELGSSLGISALGLLAIVVLLPTRLPALSRLGADAAVRLHRHLVGVLLAVLAGHVILAVALQPSRYGLVRFLGQPWRAQAAITSVACLVALIAVSIWRRKLRISYSAWRRLHGGLAATTLALAALHTYGWHRYLTHGGGGLALALLVSLPLTALAWLRFRRRSASTYLLDDVVREVGRSTTLHLRAPGGRGHRFEPGQFAWLRLADGRTRFTEHPFSYTSSATDLSRISFTVRAYEGFSARVGRLPIGTRFVVDGPHGGYRVRPRARFADELERLRERLHLRVVHILSQPPSDWGWERGRLTSAVLQRHQPATLAGWDFFLCGAGPPVDSGVQALRDIVIPPERVHAERFVEV